MKIAGWVTVVLGLMWALSTPAISLAGEADIVGVKAKNGEGGTWSFTVTVKHDDAGWDHYASQWEVLSPDGVVLGTRILLHPHVGEQPFTRSLGGVQIPKEVEKVVVRARDSVHGYGGKTIEVELSGVKAK